MSAGPTENAALGSDDEIRSDSSTQLFGKAREPAPELPAQIGRYRVERLLGSGGFGLVYLAHDEQLSRSVAVKVPHPKRLVTPEDAEPYLREARLVASLDHPHIVPVYDVGSTADFPCFVVSKFIDGTSLSVRARRAGYSWTAAAELVAMLAAALHYAHKQGVVHRDIKPGNILIDRAETPFIVDFGLALREQDDDRPRTYAGTPSYMSPEQARGEGHRVDGRSDIFSLGVVLYELLTGRKPFHGQSTRELFDQIATSEPKPVRQIADGIPRELERICLRALAKRAIDRYLTARDFADDLRQLVQSEPAAPTIAEPAHAAVQTAAVMESTPHAGVPSNSTRLSASQLVRIVPKGLRSFDRHDADFFLELLPGPRDRNGLPDSVRFWKTHIEDVDSEALTIGLIYGPSGCGKSSLVKAGLLPLLSDRVCSVYVEATADDTETRLVDEIRRRVPGLPRHLTLRDTLAAVRRGHGLAPGHKLLIVLDQFEQWLYARKEHQNSELVQALRHCDGVHVQCIVMVRDDFWMAVTRFLWELEVSLREGQNSTVVDLFDVDHARKVLRAFGRAFGRIPEGPRVAGEEQQEFVSEAVAGLAEEGKVVCVRLAVFAEMTKAKPWTPPTLREIGGARGVGLAFLEETFSGAHAPPRHRYHQQAARAVLKHLLPESGSDLRGQKKSAEELMLISGYRERPDDFEDLLQLLDGEIRLITPADAQADDVSGRSSSAERITEKSFQLTHDFLVPELRNWITRKQSESRGGRALLRLDERARLWQVRQDPRQLPSAAECAGILALTRSASWSEPQRQMMKQATWRHGMRWGTALLLVAVLATAVRLYISGQQHTATVRETELLVEAALAAPAEAVPFALKELAGRPELALPMLQRQFANEAAEPGRRLHAALGLAEFGRVESDYLVSSIPTAAPGECGNIVTALEPVREQALSWLGERIAAAESAHDWERKARFAIVAWHLGDSSAARGMFENSPDPLQRSVIIDVLPRWHGAADRLLNSARGAKDAALLSGVCLGLGSVPAEEYPAPTIAELKRDMAELYANDPERGGHSAAGWALRQWRSLPESPAAELVAPGRQWQMNSVGMTMLLVVPGSFTRTTNAPSDDPTAPVVDQQQIVTLKRPFLLSDREVSRRVFQEFIDDPTCPDANKPRDWPGSAVERSPTPEHPVQGVSWRDAVLFCNWLTRREGLTAYYLPDGNLVADADGYRLPSEAEWEYACRAGTITDHSFGSDLQRLERYVVSQSNHTEPCASRLPNAWGFFDLHGNVYEWCGDCFAPYDSAQKVVDPTGPERGAQRVLRGGAFDYGPVYASSYDRARNIATYRSYTIGFRPARSVR